MASRMRVPLVLCTVGAALAAGVGAAAGNAAGAGLCAYPVSTTQAGGKVTTTFSVAAGCDVQVSLVAVSYTAAGPVMAGSASGRFAAGAATGTTSLTVDLPCGSGETDLVLGPPALYPPAQLDLSAVPFSNACRPAPAPVPAQQPAMRAWKVKAWKLKGKAACNAGRGNGSEGSPAHWLKPGRDRGRGLAPTLDCDPGRSGGRKHGGD